jgi:hypothetical protein
MKYQLFFTPDAFAIATNFEMVLLFGTAKSG